MKIYNTLSKQKEIFSCNLCHQPTTNYPTTNYQLSHSFTSSTAKNPLSPTCGFTMISSPPVFP